MGVGPRNYSDLTLKKLFMLSGNKCPNCDTTLVLTDGTVLAEICHIEGANKGGERYNELMTDTERASFNNLILLCSNCHKKTNNIVLFDKDRLVQMKKEHEAKYISYIPAKLDESRFVSSQSYDIDFTEKEEWGILEEIIKYALENVPNENLSVEQIRNNSGFLNTKEKVKLNFPSNQVGRFAELFTSTTARKLTIENFLSKLSDTDPYKVDELKETITSKYCSLKGVTTADTKIGDIKVIENLALTLIPIAKINSPHYQAIAKALVIQTFEYCFIGEKTIQERQKESTIWTLFD